MVKFVKNGSKVGTPPMFSTMKKFSSPCAVFPSKNRLEPCAPAGTWNARNASDTTTAIARSLFITPLLCLVVPVRARSGLAATSFHRRHPEMRAAPLHPLPQPSTANGFGANEDGAPEPDATGAGRPGPARILSAAPGWGRAPIV